MYILSSFQVTECFRKHRTGNKNSILSTAFKNCGFQDHFCFFGGGAQCVACGILVPWPGIEPVHPQQWKSGVLTTGSPGNSPQDDFWDHVYVNIFQYQQFYSPYLKPRSLARWLKKNGTLSFWQETELEEIFAHSLGQKVWTHRHAPLKY